MPEVKWIKITTDIFSDEKIKLIDALPEKDAIFVIWIKLLVLAGKINDAGTIYLNEEIPYTDEMLSTIFNRPVSIIRMALETFKRLKMIRILDDLKIEIVNWDKHQNIEGLDKIRADTRKRVAAYRNRRKKEDKNRLDKTTALPVTLGNVTNKNEQYLPLAKLLYEEHKKLDEKYLNGNTRLNETFEHWANDIRLLVEKDGRDIGEVKAVIRWTQEPGNFWNANILSGSKLRKQYPRLILQMQKNGGDRFTKKRESEYLERNREGLKKIIGG